MRDAANGDVTLERWGEDGVLAGEEDGEYPPGTPIRENAWVLALTALRAS